MTLLEAARRLAKAGFTPWEDSCHLTCELCGADGAGEEGPFPHEADCPWLQMPAIVAALEAGNEVAAYVRHLREHDERSFETISATLGFRNLLREFDDRFHATLRGR